MSESKEIKLRLPNIGFDMPITDAIMELEKLRYKRLGGSTWPCIFFQLQHISHMLESIGSSRIEGNSTESSHSETNFPSFRCSRCIRKEWS